MSSPDPFLSGEEGNEIAAWNAPNWNLGQSIDVFVTPAPDARWSPTDPIVREDDLGPAELRPQQDQRRLAREETRFLRLETVVVGQVFELVRIKFARPGYLARVATFLEVSRGNDVLYLSNDLSDPDPFPVADLTIRWHLIRDDAVRTDEAAFLTAAPVTWLPTGHTVGGLPTNWADMRYHWGQRQPNKIARIPRATNVRLFAEFRGDASSLSARIGGQLGGWEGQK